MKTERTHKRRWLAWLIIGLLAYGLFLMSLLPAGLVWEQARERGMTPVGVELQAISGTLWNGGAGQLQTPGGLVLSDLRWRFTPGSLFTARLGWDLQATPSGGRAVGHVALGASTVQLSDVRGDLPATLAITPFLTWPVSLDGRLVLDLSSYRADYQGYVHEARGVLGWIDAAAGLPEALPLGDLRAEIAEDDEGGLRLDIRDQGGPLIVEGVAQVSVAGGYQVDGVAGTRDDAHPNIAQALRMLGNPGRDGQVNIQLSGAL